MLSSGTPRGMSNFPIPSIQVIKRSYKHILIKQLNKQ